MYELSDLWPSSVRPFPGHLIELRHQENFFGILVFNKQLVSQADASRPLIALKYE
jgi:hypothetical protein